MVGLEAYCIKTPHRAPTCTELDYFEKQYMPNSQSEPIKIKGFYQTNYTIQYKNPNDGGNPLTTTIFVYTPELLEQFVYRPQGFPIKKRPGRATTSTG